jgi:hypothetical protein
MSLAPPAPTNLSAIAGKCTAIISFVIDMSGVAPLTNYLYSLNGGSFIPLDPPDTVSPITIRNLTAGTAYSIIIQAINSVGEGVVSQPIIVVPTNTCAICLFEQCACGNTTAPPPFQPQVCPAPPYNSEQNPNFGQYASTQPQFPLHSGSNASQLFRSNANNTLYNSINSQNAQIKALNGTTNNIPYRFFKSDQERIMYLQGQMNAQTRSKAAYPNQPTPAGVPCTSLYSSVNNS